LGAGSLVGFSSANIPSINLSKVGVRDIKQNDKFQNPNDKSSSKSKIQIVIFKHLSFGFDLTFEL